MLANGPPIKSNFWGSFGTLTPLVIASELTSPKQRMGGSERQGASGIKFTALVLLLLLLYRRKDSKHSLYRGYGFALRLWWRCAGWGGWNFPAVPVPSAVVVLLPWLFPAAQPGPALSLPRHRRAVRASWPPKLFPTPRRFERRVQLPSSALIPSSPGPLLPATPAGC